MNLSQFTAAERNAIRDAVELVTTADPSFKLLPEHYSSETVSLLSNSINTKLSSDADPAFSSDELAFIVSALDAYCNPPFSLPFLFDKPRNTTAASLVNNKISRLV